MKKMKEFFYGMGLKSPIRKWALGLKGWKFLFYQLVVGGIFFILVEIMLNQIGMTLLPWK